MAKRTELSEHTYSEIVWTLNPPCKDMADKPTAIDVSIAALREEFLNLVSKNQRMRLPLRRDKSGAGCMTDVLGNGKPVVADWALPFGHRLVPRAHINWLREQIKTRGLSRVISL